MVFRGVLWRPRRQKGLPRHGWSVGNQTAGIEALEDRLVLTAIVMTVQEQLLLELINRARSDPSAEAARWGIGLNDGLTLTPPTITTEPKQPLAPNQILTDVAGAHSQEMLDHDYFAHKSEVDGREPSDRATDAGYPVGAGENIAWGGSTGQINQNQHVYERHEGLFKSAGHRENMLLPNYQEAGMGMRYGLFTNPDDGVTYNASMATEMFANPPGNPFLTGVVFTDASDGSADDDGFFTIGEQVGSGTIIATDSGSGLSYTTTIGLSGGYSLQVPSGTYTVAASGGSLGTTYVLSDVVVIDQNIKVDFETTTATVGPAVNGTDDMAFYSNGGWWRDANGNGWDNDPLEYFGFGGTDAFAGNWNADSVDEMGFYSDGAWWRDTNGNGWDNDPFEYFGFVGAVPVPGDWNGDGVDDMGIYRNGVWWRDTNGNGWDNDPFEYFGFEGADPVAGDWNGDAVDDRGFYRNGVWWRDTNGNGWDNDPFEYFGFEGADPVAGDWNGDAVDDRGFYRNGVWWRDTNGNGWDNDPFEYFGFAGADPVAGDWNGPGAALLAAGGEVSSAADAVDLTQVELRPLVPEAVSGWAELGLPAADVEALSTIQVIIADLPGLQLGLATQDTIYVDVNAAGRGWFVDPTPGQNEEFGASGGSGELRALDPAAIDRVDLLTVLYHELGHSLGLNDLDSSVDRLMSGALRTGVRREPIAAADME